MIKRFTNTLLLIVLVGSFMFVPAVRAVGVDDDATDPNRPTIGGTLNDAATLGGFDTSKTAEATTAEAAIQLLTLLFQVVGLFFLVLTVYAGFLWMTAGGNEEQVGKSKALLRNAVIGFTIIILSYAITTFVGNALSKLATPSDTEGYEQ